MAFKIPNLSTELIAQLDKAYPARCIQHNESATDAHRYAGRRQLIDELLTHLQKASAGTGVLTDVLSRRNGPN